MRRAKKLTFVPRVKPLPPFKLKGVAARTKALGVGIIANLARHMNRLGFTVETFAAECKMPLHKFLSLTKRPQKLDLRTISLWSSIIKADLLVTRLNPGGYYGRQHGKRRLEELTDNRVAYLRCSKQSHIFCPTLIKKNA